MVSLLVLQVIIHSRIAEASIVLWHELLWGDLNIILIIAALLDALETESNDLTMRAL